MNNIFNFQRCRQTRIMPKFCHNILQITLGKQHVQSRIDAYDVHIHRTVTVQAQNKAQ